MPGSDYQWELPTVLKQHDAWGRPLDVTSELAVSVHLAYCWAARGLLFLKTANDLSDLSMRKLSRTAIYVSLYWAMSNVSMSS